MVNFEDIYKEFEKTKNVVQFCKDYSANDVATRFLLIRSLDDSHLIELLNHHSTKTPSGKAVVLMERLFNTKITVTELLAYIESKRKDLVLTRSKELEGLYSVISEFDTVNCGVRNDKIDDLVKKLVRDKEIKSFKTLEEKIGHLVLTKINDYTLWAYFNQTTNDLLEMFFIKHPNVIPTLRKIHSIDFFLKIDDKIIPFDLKVTHISDDYFEKYSKGLKKTASDYAIGEDDSEIKKIKDIYSKNKKFYKLPNYGSLKKTEILDLLEMLHDDNIDASISEIKDSRKNMVLTTSQNLHPLEWWNYKYQGERLFCNNNRCFVFLAYSDKFEDGRPLKKEIDKIGEKINYMLDNISSQNVSSINYYYTKDPALKDYYSAQAISTMFYI